MTEEQQQETLGERVRRLRIEKWFTQIWLSKAAGVNSMTIVKIEHEKTKNPNFLTIVALSEALEVDIHTFVEVLERPVNISHH